MRLQRQIYFYHAFVHFLFKHLKACDGTLRLFIHLPLVQPQCQRVARPVTAVIYGYWHL